MNRQNRQSELRVLLRNCLVRIDADKYGRGGSGFFVAPNRVLTCAHIVGEVIGRPVSGFWQKQCWRGIVEYSSPQAGAGSDGRPGVPAASDKDGIWPLPDLAIILLDVPLDHACVRLSSRNATEGNEMAAVGWCRNLGRLSSFSLFSVDLHYPGPTGPDEDQQLLRLVGDRLEPGMSGAPLLDLSTGEVCGVLKSTRSKQQEGYAVPIGYLRTALPAELRLALWRDHDTHHATKREWTRAQDQLWQTYSARPGGPCAALNPSSTLLRPIDEVELLGLLARLPEPLDPIELCRECLPVEPAPEPVDLLDLREAVFWLADRMYERGQLHPVHVCAEVLAEHAPPELSGQLRDWSVDVVTPVSGGWEKLKAWRKQRSNRPPRSDSEDFDSVIVRVRPSPNNPQEHEVTIWLYHSRAGFKLIHQEAPRPLEEVWERLRTPLQSALRELQGANTLIEMVLPPYLFDTPVDQWELPRRISWDQHKPAAQDRGYVAKIGYRHPVVVRDLERFEDAERRNHARPRWAWLRAQRNGIPLWWMRCEQRPGDLDLLYRRFMLSEEHAAVGLPGPACEEPGGPLLDLAIEAGIPVALWRRRPCQEHDSTGPQPRPCSGERFQRRMESALAGLRLMELPGWIRRRRLGASLGPGEHASQSQDDRNNDQVDIALFWDNPSRVPPLEPLVALRSHQGEPR